MKIILFGATGMIGQGVLREALLDPTVESVLAVVRSPTGRTDAKLRELLHDDFYDYTRIAGQLAGYDACLFCLGVSSAGMKEPAYHRVTYDLTLAAARAVLAASPAATFLYISGGGTDSTEKGSSMWARVKGQTENALLGLGLKRAYMLRPAAIQPRHGIRSKTRLYSVLYTISAPLWPILRLVIPRYVTTTERLGRAMLKIARDGADKPVLENHELDALGKALLAAGHD